MEWQLSLIEGKIYLLLSLGETTSHVADSAYAERMQCDFM